MYTRARERREERRGENRTRAQHGQPRKDERACAKNECVRWEQATVKTGC